jgi:hypothetical protein
VLAPGDDPAARITGVLVKLISRQPRERLWTCPLATQAVGAPRSPHLHTREAE